MAKKKPEDNKSCCWTCDWIAEFEWVCCNGDCEYRGDNPPMYAPEFKCGHHKPKPKGEQG